SSRLHPSTRRTVFALPLPPEPCCRLTDGADAVTRPRFLVRRKTCRFANGVELSMASSVAPRLQVVLSVVPDVPLVLGVPTALRAAHALVDAPVDRFILLAGSIAALAGRWTDQLRVLPLPAVSWLRA